jgi:hypothetical protein
MLRRRNPVESNSVLYKDHLTHGTPIRDLVSEEVKKVLGFKPKKEVKQRGRTPS